MTSNGIYLHSLKVIIDVIEGINAKEGETS